jgi:hypothetical protein
MRFRRRKERYSLASAMLPPSGKQQHVGVRLGVFFGLYSSLRRVATSPLRREPSNTAHLSSVCSESLESTRSAPVKVG